MSPPAPKWAKGLKSLWTLGGGTSVGILATWYHLAFDLKASRMEEKIKAHCNTCGGKKNHLVLHTEEDVHFEESWTEISTYRLIKCAGCDRIHLQHETDLSGLTDADGNPVISMVYYPPPLSRRRPDWMSGFPNAIWMLETDIGQLLNEVYTSLQNGSNRLAAMGIRAIVEIMMIDKIGGDTGSFNGNINAFFVLGYVALQQQASFKAALIEAGHAAMHRGFRPTDEQLSTLLDITEGLVASIYFHEQSAAKLSSAIPPRQIAGKSRS